jgi:hypothetical protein
MYEVCVQISKFVSCESSSYELHEHACMHKEIMLFDLKIVMNASVHIGPLPKPFHIQIAYFLKIHFNI